VQRNSPAHRQQGIFVTGSRSSVRSILVLRYGEWHRDKRAHFTIVVIQTWRTPQVVEREGDALGCLKLTVRPNRANGKEIR
jgi:hypothetical protein